MWSVMPSGSTDFNMVDWADRNGSIQTNTLHAEEPHELLKDFSVFLLVILTPITIVSNLITLISTWLIPMLCTQTDYIIAGLAFADVLVGVVCIPILLLEEIDETSDLLKEQRWNCIMQWFGRIFTIHCSLQMTFLLVTNLFVGFNFPFFYRAYVSPKRVIYVIIMIFVIEAIFDLWMFGSLMEYNESEPDLTKRCSKENCPAWALGYGYLAKMTAYAVSPLCMTVQVAFIVKRRAKYINAQNRYYGNSSDKAEYTIVFILMTLFVPLWVPNMVLTVLHDHEQSESSFYKNLDLLAQLLVIVNSSINAPIHAYSKEIYRVAYRHILTKPPCQWGSLSYVMREYSAIKSGCLQTTRTEIEHIDSVHVDQLKHHTEQQFTGDSTGSRSTVSYEGN